MKKFLSIFMSIILIFPMLITGEVSAEIINAPEITFSTTKTKPNETGVIQLFAKNGTSETITINGYTILDPDNSDLKIIGDKVIKNIDKPISKDEQLYFGNIYFEASKSGSYLIEIDVTYNDNEPIKVSNSIVVSDNLTPNILLNNFECSKSTVTAGDSFDVAFNIDNIGDTAAYDIVIDVSNYSETTFMPGQSKPTLTCSSLSTNTSRHLTIKTSEEMKSGVYPLTFSYTYQNEDGTAFSGSSTTYIKVENPDVPVDTSTAPYLTLTSLKSSDETVTSGDEFTLSFNIKNLGKRKAKNIYIGVNNYTSETFIPVKLDTIERAGDLLDGSETSFNLKVGTSSIMKTGHFPLEIGYTYEDEEGKQYTGNYTTFISVVNPNAPEETPDGAKTTPRIIIDNYSLDVDNVIAGKPFTFNFTLKNTNTKVNVSNMKITVESKDAIFTPVEGSNSFYTASLATGQSENYSLSLTTNSGCESKSYPVTINIDYEDEIGTPYSSVENINLLVTQPIRVEIMDFNVPTDMPMGMPINISFRYFNKGKTKLDNFSICMEGDFTMERGDEYVGALMASSYDEYSGMIFPSGTGEQNGTLVLKFEDSTGTEQRIEQPFTVNISEQSFEEPIDEPMFPDEGQGEIIDWDENGNPIFADADKSDGLAWWAITLICVGGAIIVTIVIVIIVKKVKKKKVLEEYDDDDYDDEE